MKRLSVFLSLLLLLGLCSTTHQQMASPVGLVKLENYFFKESTMAVADTNYYLVTNQTVFDDLFGMAKTMNNKIIIPDFKGQWVVSIALKETNKNTSVHFVNAAIAGKSMNVYAEISGGNETLSYTTVPLALATVPKSGNVKNIHFFVNGNDVKTIHVK